MTDDEYDELFRTSYPRLVALGLAMSAERHVAQDLAQETLLRAYHHRDDLARYDSPFAWCRRVMGNLLIDHHRRRSAERVAVERVQNRAASADRSGDADPARIVTSPTWDDLVASLTSQQRLITTLYYAHDQAVGDIAGALDIAPGTVKSALAKARANVRRHLSGVDRPDTEEWS